ncbi:MULTISPECIES: tetratricopeptide repeat protein [Moorena]|uniref:Uncharacterized protein n=1 Tax=Moorena producens 3L TaxID=489825 RepID=F4XSY1_9CYAN|nr:MULTISPECIES: tetratricopeptide repeat protein [Moorena]EGJ32321.1 hypothetical protein LYNGBM3L_26280 [Moorena producens 3L]NEP65938.1 tetratricopeptide repeat protein [Moorena sp. SIO3A5]NES46335.1 tetratricopeptide repeat protein [Moorena sp. SIO2C4]OLT67464.1 hypothetical protein BI334_22730 [Moorena producens 3L]
MDYNDQMNAQRGETFRLSGAYEQAIKIFKELQSKYPDNAWVNAHLGTTYYQLMNYDQAEKYLNTAIEKNDKYLWAHAQLGETYRLRAIVENRKKEYVDSAIKHFQTALDNQEPTNSNYAWALAHLGATYRLKMFKISQKVKEELNKELEKGHVEFLKKIIIDEDSKNNALACLNRAIELIPTYTWAWGMRATVYRLVQEYEDSHWDLSVEIVIAPESQVLQFSPSPVPFLESRRLDLYEHALLCFYLTKIKDEDKKERYYGRAIAYAQKALMVQPGDLIAYLILTVIEAQQNKEKLEDINDDIIEKFNTFIKNAKLPFSEVCQTVLRYQISANKFTTNQIKAIIEYDNAYEHPLTKLVLNDVINNPHIDSIDSAEECEEAQLWLWKNFALTETCSNVLFLLSDLSVLLEEDSIIGTANLYRDIGFRINSYYTIERVFQTPVLSDIERSQIIKKAITKYFSMFLNPDKD